MAHHYIGDSRHDEFHFVHSAKRPNVFGNFWRYSPGAPQPMFTLPDGRKKPLRTRKWRRTISRRSSPPGHTTLPLHSNALLTDTIWKFARLFPVHKMRPIYDGGHAIGFDIAVNDNDEGGPLKQQLHWSGMNDLYWRDTKFFGTLILYDAPEVQHKGPW